MAHAPESSLVLAAADYDPAARELLVDSYLPQIGGMARAYSASGAVDRAELMQEGVVGLLRAADRYDATLGTPFWPMPRGGCGKPCSSSWPISGGRPSSPTER